VFHEQSKVIKKINKDLGKEVYNNFVPNYQSLASLSQIFQDKMPIKSRVILEKKIIETLTTSPADEPPLVPVDNLVMRAFTDRFNQSYGGLLSEQRELLNKYITSFHEHGVDFRLFVGSELKRIHEKVESSLSLGEVSEDSKMIENTQKVLAKIKSFNVSSLSEGDILRLLKLQKLAKEYDTDAD